MTDDVAEKDYAALNLLDAVIHQSGSAGLRSWESGMRLALADVEIAKRLVAAIDGERGDDEADKLARSIAIEVGALRHDLSMDQDLARALFEQHETEMDTVRTDVNREGALQSRRRLRQMAPAMAEALDDLMDQTFPGWREKAGLPEEADPAPEPVTDAPGVGYPS